MKKTLFSLSFLLAVSASAFAAIASYDHCSALECEVRARKNSLPHMPVRQSTSLNWSGYAAATSLTRPSSSSVTAVEGSWTVPTLSPLPGHTYSSAWVGIDGYSSSTVEQIGTEHDWTPTGQQNYAWFEMYPQNGYELVGFPVNKGDNMGATVVYKGRNVFQLTIVNYTHEVYTVVPTSYTTVRNAKRNSAEWIVEAPSSESGVLPLAKFGTIAMTNCTATINGKTAPINSTAWKNDPLTMTTMSGIPKAVPSKLSSNGQSFTVTWKHQ